MNKLNTLISSIIVITGIAFVTLIVYVSILGDNHKIDFLVNHVFEDLKSHNYDKICHFLSEEEQGPSCADTCFLMEMAFLSRFNLLDKTDYAVTIRRDHFWIPFVTGDHVSVSVSFAEKKSNSFVQYFHHTDDENFIKDFIQVQRIDGVWKITGISLETSSLFPVFKQVKNSVVLDRYVITGDQGEYTLKENTVDPGTLSSLERRVLQYNLEKLSRLEK